MGATAAGALLLHPSEGALGSLGFLAALLLVAIAAGFWAGGPHPPTDGASAEAVAEAVARAARVRWFLAVGSFVAAGLFLNLMTTGATIPIGSRERGLAVLLLLGAPGYAIGWLLAALEGRSRLLRGDVGIGPAGFTGAAVGVLLASAVLIPRIDPEFLFLGGGLVLAFTGLVDLRLAELPIPTGRGFMHEKAVLITGVGGKGQLGFALARAFLADGARVMVTGLAADVERHAAELSAHGDVMALRADLSSPADVGEVIQEVARRFGRLDVLINAAGGLSVIKPLAETSAEEWRAELERNATTAFLTCRAALPLLRESRGTIINFASPAALRARAGIGAYSAAKAGVVALTRSLALEERANGVRVNAILPGFVDTEENRRSVPDPASVKWVTRGEIARVALFLAGAGASGVSGEAIQVLGEALE